jgi:hypothetical protein
MRPIHNGHQASPGALDTQPAKAPRLEVPS